ncbi:ABC transporter permease [Cohnella phaseoli]|uniref:Fluoroquinolone transport system permease protein n=1 Tax=Cohnella phaseoli TaxID=456490 RepID=A0A3D9KU63_9BACL|nr:ABC transporter permease [Cohnella phaseoli]RED89205.1 fluoroquinolone transport system permease protein [Cohnella phaseoli]
MRPWKLFLFDVRFQWKQRFYFVYVFICAVYVGLLHTIPDSYVDTTLVLLTFSDPSALGLLLAGGIVLLERDMGIWSSLFATPIKLAEYLLAKCLSLGLLSLAAAFAIHLPVGGWPTAPIYFSLGVLLTSCLFTLIGIATSILSQSINGFLIRSQAYSLVFIFPVLGYLNVFDMPLYRLLPTHGSLLLMSGSLYPLSHGEGAYAIAILIVWIAIAGFLTIRLLSATVRYADGGHRHEQV